MTTLKPGTSKTVVTAKTFDVRGWHTPRQLVITVDADGTLHLRPKGLRADAEMTVAADALWSRLSCGVPQ